MDYLEQLTSLWNGKNKAIQVTVYKADAINGYGWSLRYTVTLLEVRKHCRQCGELILKTRPRCRYHEIIDSWTIEHAFDEWDLNDAYQKAINRRS